MVWDVVIAGAGPNGLMLACELALGGVRPLVLERRTEPGTEPRANGLVGQVVRMFDRRGLHERLTGSDAPPEPVAGFAFAAFPLPLHLLGADNPVYTLMVPQRRLEEVLAGRAAELGVPVRRGVELTGLTQFDDHVLVEAGGQRFEARYLVGADGGHSTTRKLAGIGFPGVTRDDTVSRTAAVGVPPGLRDPVTGGLDVPGYGVIPPFLHHRTERGMIVFAPFPDGRTIVSVSDSETSGGEFTLDELRATARRVLGVPLPVAEPEGDGPHLRRRTVGGNTRLAERFRDRRVLLVGDAAHVHSALGGPGLNLGLQDAVNLGWKLAAQVRGHAPDDLLDTYESERRPAGERVVMHTMAQAVLIGPGPEVTALRALFGELLSDRATLRRIADLISGADIRYDGAGRWAPDLTLDDGTRLAELTRSGRPLLIARDAGLAAVAGPWADRVDVHATSRPGPSMLLRPDCYVAWEGEEAAGLEAALRRWFSSPALRAA